MTDYQEHAKMDPEHCHGFEVEDATCVVDIGGDDGFAALRIRHDFTPVSTHDDHGDVGQIAWDIDYLYVKTNRGWKRARLENF